MKIADNARYNTNSYFSDCNSYRKPYCNNYIWVGSRYGNNFCPDELEVFYEVLAWNWRQQKKQRKKKKDNSNNNKPTKNK